MGNLYHAPNGTHCRITAIPNTPLLPSLGIFQGAIVSKKTTYQLGGPVLLDIQSREVAIGKDLALHIAVEGVTL